MKINQIRLTFSLLIGIIYFSNQFIIIHYLLAMWISLELLHLNKRYAKDASNKMLNFIFWLYTISIILNRTRTIKFHEYTEQVINIGEHFFFAIVIGLKLASYYKLTGFQMNKWSILQIAIALNVIGFINELYQNVMCGRHLFDFINDSYKDMVVNLIGSLIFMAGIILILKLKDKKLENLKSVNTVKA